MTNRLARLALLKILKAIFQSEVKDKTFQKVMGTKETIA